MPQPRQRRGAHAFVAALAVLHLPVWSVTAAAPSAPTLSCGAGLTCAKKKWCPPAHRDDSSCRRGHTGRGCSECLDDFYFNKRGLCEECPPLDTVLASWGIAATACVVLVVLTYHYAAMDLTALTIAVTHFQLSYVYFSFDFEYPRLVMAIYGPLEAFLGFGFVLGRVEGWASPACLGLSRLPFAAWWGGQMLAPFLLMLPLLAIFMSAEARERRDRLADEAKASEDRVLSVSEYEARKAARLRSKRSAQAILLICISSLMNGVHASAQVWFCPEFADGSRRIRDEPSVVCSWNDAAYRSLMVVSGVFFALYYFGTSGILMYIIDCEEGRRVSAVHFVTHARLLRDATLVQQLSFSWKLFWRGQQHGDKMERRRLFRRFCALGRVPIAVRRLQALRKQPPSDRYAFIREVDKTRAIVAKLNRSRRKPPRRKPAFFLDAFPVFVSSDQQSGAWFRGIFHGLDDHGLPLVAVGEGSALGVKSYALARMDFEDGRHVVIESSLLAWQNQTSDPINAMSGAPLGEYGRIALDKASKKLMRNKADGAAALLPHVDISISSTAQFTFHLNLTEPLGFSVRQRLGRVLAKEVDPFGQGAIAAMSSNTCAIRRIGGKVVRTPEDFQLAIVKRRIVSAQLRHKAMKAGSQNVIALSSEDQELIAHAGVAGLISPSELTELVSEISDHEGGHLVHCTVTYLDLNFDTVRHLPSDFAAFHDVASFKRAEPFWETFGFILSCYKSSSRHFEQWANIRKVAAIFIQALTFRSTTLQAVIMLAVCVVALALQTRLRPYDDENVMNDMNNADAVISNNVLEEYLLMCQIAQLGLGLLTLYVTDLSETLITALYISIIALAVVLCLVALSAEFSKAAFSASRALAPYMSTVQSFLGVATSEDESTSARHRRKTSAQNAMDLLSIARKYESSKAAQFEADQKTKLGRIMQNTVGTDAAKRALQVHRASLLAEKQALAMEKSAWVARRKAMDGHLFTVADTLGHLGKKSAGSRAREAGLAEERRLRKEATKDFHLNSEKAIWHARRRNSGGKTKIDSLGHFNQTTEARRRSLAEAQQHRRFSGEHALADAKAEWETRLAQGGRTTTALDVGHLGNDTVAASTRRRGLEWMRGQKAASLAAETENQVIWKERQEKHGRSTQTEDIGRLEVETEAFVRRKSAVEAAKRESVLKAKKEEEEKHAHKKLWLKRQKAMQAKIKQARISRQSRASRQSTALVSIRSPLPPAGAGGSEGATPSSTSCTSTLPLGTAQSSDAPSRRCGGVGVGSPGGGGGGRNRDVDRAPGSARASREDVPIISAHGAHARRTVEFV